MYRYNNYGNSYYYYRYYPNPLGMPQAIGQEKNGLILQAVTLTSLESNFIFDRCSPRAKDYEVVQLAVTNKTDQVYELNAENIKLSVAPTWEVAYKVGFNIGLSIILWIFLGVPLTLLIAEGFNAFLLLNMFLLVIAFVDALTKRGFNKKIERDFEERAISDDSELLIYPKRIMNRVMFVKKKDYKTSFNVDLVNQATGEVVTFPVDLK